MPETSGWRLAVAQNFGAASAKAEPLRKAWYTFVVALALLLVAFPGLAASQVSQAMQNYVRDLDDPWRGFNWPTAYLTLLAFLTVGRALRHWTARLLGFKPGEIRKQSAYIQIFVGFTWAAPWLGLALIFLQASIDLDGLWWNPFTWLMLLAVAVPTAFYFLSQHPRVRTLFESFDANTTVQMWLDLFPIILFALAVVLLSISGPMLALSRFLGPPALLAFALSAFVSFCGWAFITGRRLKLPIFWIAAVAAVLFAWLDWNDNHPIRSLAGPVAAKPQGPAATLVKWMELKQHPKRPVILVSAEGGGIRAAYFTAVTLARIADHCPAAADRIFVINGVSGGSVGAAIFAAIVHENPLQKDPATNDFPACDFSNMTAGYYENQVNNVLRQDHLSPVLARFLFPDTVQRFLPFPIDALDRQVAFEDGLAAAFRDEVKFTDGAKKDTLSESIYDVIPDSAHASTPYLLFNTTSVETGERVVAGNILFEARDGVPNMRSFAAMLPDTNFSLATLAATSARFPYLSPSGYLVAGGKKERFVDGGYFDNSGAATLLDMFTWLTDPNTKELAPFANTPIIALHIGNNPVCRLATDKNQTEPKDWKKKKSCKPPERHYESDEQLGPVRAVLSSRDGRVSWTLEQLETVIRRTNEAGNPPPDPAAAKPVVLKPDKGRLLRVQMLDEGTEIPLGWLLSAGTAQMMTDQIGAKREGDNCRNTRTRSNRCAFDELGLLFDPGVLVKENTPAAEISLKDFTMNVPDFIKEKLGDKPFSAINILREAPGLELRELPVLQALPQQ